MEYYGRKHGDFLQSIFRKKYRDWFNFFFNEIDNFNLNDIDGSRTWHQNHNFIQFSHCLNVNDELSIYEHKKYPKTIKRNKEILNQYIEMCHQHNIIPIAVLLPFTQMAQKHYPQNSLKEFFEILNPFLERMEFINLWDMKLPNSYFEDTTHLKITGAVEVTKVIKDKVSQILNK